MKTYILRAEDEFESAKYLFQNDFYRGTINHCYYACIWLMRGMLAERGIFTKILDGALAFFEEYFIKKDLLPLTFTKFIYDIVRKYNVKQTDITGDFWYEETLYVIEKTEEFLSFVKELAFKADRDN
ncbi:Uncharacterized protein, contains HEPN domain, UPF0332 family [Pseudarcicella hirudinis]|uniref:Uncharacterized protein, contains HEPN domain, UPF0332 family n=1 Tax=Pseudarcicella hirudinis TaxID=1079859 RepID=A0A1I5QHI8_9BACT|nr:HEPN domain-containing protein [Pseudarcicella hirudinis]SFP45748.1 Uncharacterized protein, contains HEPN domain, UPF0332 family [Pseudarcicella hirudinis]